MLNKHASVMLGSLLGLSLCATAATAAITIPPAAISAGTATQADAPLLQDAKVVVSIGAGPRYDRNMHGNRCNYRHDNCNHYYRGHYYQNQWWAFPLVIGNTMSNPGRHMHMNHVQWCSDHYRSYNRRTNTWLSTSGQYRQCNSPF